MKNKQFDMLYSILQKISDKQDRMLVGLEKVEKGFNTLPEGSQIVGKLANIITGINKEISSLKDELQS